MKIKLTNKEIRQFLDIEEPEFPKYVSQIVNLANQNAQGTRPKMVGQMSELIQQFKGKELQGWKEWYLKNHPEAIKNATNKIMAMVENLKEAMFKIDKMMVEKWVEELVIVQTFLGLKFQKALLQKIAKIKQTNCRLAEPSEEGKGIDGYVGKTPISIKPETYKIKMALLEKISVKVIYYKKVKDGIEAEFEF